MSVHLFSTAMRRIRDNVVSLHEKLDFKEDRLLHNNDPWFDYEVRRQITELQTDTDACLMAFASTSKEYLYAEGVKCVVTYLTGRALAENPVLASVMREQFYYMKKWNSDMLHTAVHGA